MINTYQTIPNNNHRTNYEHKQLSSKEHINIERKMSIEANKIKKCITYCEKEENNENDDDEDEDENSKLLSYNLENQNNDKQQCDPQVSIVKLRSILRKRTEKTMSKDNGSDYSQQTSNITDDNVNNNDEKDSDYTGDENDEETDEATKRIEKKNQNNEQKHHHRSNYSRQERKNQLIQTSSSTPLVFPLERAKTEIRAIETRYKGTFHPNNQSPNRTTCVTFNNDQSVIIHRSSSTPQFGGVDTKPNASVTYIDINENINNTSSPMPITTTTRSPSTFDTEFRPVYVSPLKYRPLVGLSANDNRLLLEKRVSLLGKPVVFHPIHKRSPAYRRNQMHIYNFLERPHGCKAIIYHTFVFVTVFFCLFLSILATMPDYESRASTVLLYTEVIVVIWLAIELTLRVWSAGCRSRYQTLIGRLRFMKKPFCALDFIVIMATVITLCMNTRTSNGVFAASALRGLRFFQILRMLRMDRRGGTWKLLGSVVYAHRQELITTIYIGFLVLIFSSFVMFLVEKDNINEAKGTIINDIDNRTIIDSKTNLIDTERHKFETFADALWWGIITLCTVGYGDKVPSSYTGKLIAAVCSFIGISFFALPAGILGSGFALKVQQQQRQKHYKRRKIPAVLLIQNLWRVYAADEKSLSKATWKVHVRPPKQEQNISVTTQSNPHPTSFRTRNNQSFLNRVSFRRRTPSRQTPLLNINDSSVNHNSPLKPFPNSAVAAMRSCIDTLSETASITQSVNLSVNHESSSSDNDEDHSYYVNDVNSLTITHRNAIRFIRKVKYFVSRRKFREALRPYDVTDVIEQYSTGNVDMLARMKYLQARLDKVLGISKSADSYESGPSLASRICKIERQVDNLDLKVEKLCQLTNALLERNLDHRNILLSSAPVAPIIINRIRTGNPHRFYRHRRQRSQVNQPNTTRTQIPSTSPLTSMGTPPTHHSSISPLISDIDQSRESTINLHWLFQDNLNLSTTSVV